MNLHRAAAASKPADSTAARDIAYHLHPYTNLKRLQAEGPLVIARGEGVYVFDEDGKRYLEGLAGLWCASLGFSEPRLAEAAYRQMKRLPFYHSFTGKVPEVTVELAERLVAMAPASLGKVLFANSGSESNDTAVKLAWYYHNAIGKPEKKKIIARRGAYHGMTIAAASMTELAYARNGFDLPIARFLHADCPHYYRFAAEGESEAEFVARLARQLEELILAEGPDTIAALIAEPVQGAGGVIVPPEGYFRAIQEVLRRYGILFIADEVICGFGRTGRMFGSDTFGIQPDMMTVAKALSSGYQPISALLVSDRIYDPVAEQSAALGMFGHGYTYTGHPVAAAVALETLKIYEERRILDHVRSVAPVMQEGLRRFAAHPLIGEVRGIGLIGAVELVRDKASKERFAPAIGAAWRVVEEAQRQGLILRAMPGDAVAFCPPLIIDAKEIGIMLDRFEAALGIVAPRLVRAAAGAGGRA